ncbi:MAG: flagellar assembly protein FliH [Betaproteobacteria bacterium]|uniref:Flagellar assembly protein FliH n=1 Tax=Candidatus Proximibacter danicus TaxID=2954365 RepID=A0A9D7K1M6_9PROT|nr:flagellar assembly protein FliH [Candidatus Proximibacter danicus]
MSGFIPKEKLTAYQRWEVAAFDEAEAAAASRNTAIPKTTEPAPPAEPAIPLPTAEDIERIHSEAQQAGYTVGYEEGLGEARAQAEKISALVENLGHSLQQLDQDIAEELLAVAVEIAGQVLRQSLKIKPELVLPIVREAVAALPMHHGHPALFMNPADAALVRTHLGEQLAHNGWRILEDSTIEPGGCRIESGASEVDATLQTRWRRVLDAIGTTGEWLEQKP